MAKHTNAIESDAAPFITLNVVIECNNCAMVIIKVLSVAQKIAKQCNIRNRCMEPTYSG